MYNTIRVIAHLNVYKVFQSKKLTILYAHRLYVGEVRVVQGPAKEWKRIERRSEISSG